MVSKCPSCAKEIEHEDFLFEVSCECGMAFNPFYDANVAVNADGPQVEEAPVSADAPEFAEAADAFRDIVAFGEVADSNTPVTAPAPAKKAATSAVAKTRSDQAAERERAPGSENAEAAGDRLLVPGEKLEGYTVESYLNPVSVSAAVDWEAESPLEQAFDTIWNACTRNGGNALLFTRWELSPDGGRCLVAGVPVRCQKI